MRKNWETPFSKIEEFEVNESVSACYRVRCTKSDLDHQECGSYDDQVIRGENGVYRVEERRPGTNPIGTSYDRTKPYEGEYINITINDIGNTVYWSNYRTFMIFRREFYHVGKIEVADTNHPNRS